MVGLWGFLGFENGVESKTRRVREELGEESLEEPLKAFLRSNLQSDR